MGSDIHIDNSRKAYRFILSGGGTGGHLYPALAIASKLREYYPDCEIMFVGALGKIEMDKVPKAGYNIEGLHIGGFNRQHLLKNISLPCKIVSSLWKSRSILKKFKPDLAIGTGGYASFALLYVAEKLKIPVVLQEQNFFPGITNKFLAPKAEKIFTIGEGMEKYFPADKIIVSGNPVREQLMQEKINPDECYAEFGLKPGKQTLLILGGSLGARTINNAVYNGLSRLLANNNIQILWQTGKIYYDEFLTKTASYTAGNLCIRPFIDKMDYAYRIADLVVCRAGAITISELAIISKPVILIPSPNVAEDHQTKNALSLAEKNAAILIKDTEANAQLTDTVFETLNSPTLLTSLAVNIKKFAKPESTITIVKEIEKILTAKR